MRLLPLTRIPDCSTIAFQSSDWTSVDAGNTCAAAARDAMLGVAVPKLAFSDSVGTAEQRVPAATEPPLVVAVPAFMMDVRYAATTCVFSKGAP